MNKTIAIDINNVIRDNLTQFNNVYQRYIDNTFEIDPSEITSFDMMQVYPFESSEKLYKFKYIDYAFELFGRAECCDSTLQYKLNYWMENTLKDLDDENIPNVILFSPFEIALSIQSTLSFLSRTTIRPRKIVFPVNSATIYDEADIVITTQPSLLENVPDGKIAVKIEMPYNKDIECKYTFKSMMDIINDKNETIIKLLNDYD